ncbi:DNA-processing protein DprA [Lujinxingia sediminis]|uniref:DNA-processing protein DprA n=1 Tax=Lujinxingia sediminis TaxID=2480984 RepID=A0ABY0CZ14_9DELT|nr:DNA-processing protein DprA [Lujinxingia sediminis]RVU48665.1 DNA-processing protein DprA [Lujinxingia sediminis]
MTDNSGSETWSLLGAEERGVRAALGWVGRLKARDVQAIAEVHHQDVAGWWRSGARLSEELAVCLRAGAQRRIEELEMGPAEAVERMAHWAGQTVLRGEPGYPPGLEELRDPPLYLRVSGNCEVLARGAIAVVGSRRLRPRDTAVSRMLVEAITAAGRVVVSGGALGADALAHEVALEKGVPTVVVLPGCLEEPTPASHRALFERVVHAGGVLVSEYPPGQLVRSYHFARRNELIAAMSQRVLVLRSGRKGGTMLTVEAAERIGRPLAAVPGDPEDELCRGCFDAIRRGASLVADANDLRAWLGAAEEPGRSLSRSPVANRSAGQAVLPRLAPLPTQISDEARTLFEGARQLVGDDVSVSVDALAAQLAWPVPRLLGALLELELCGAVQKLPGAERVRLLCA